MSERRCSMCGDVKPIDQFEKRATKPMGRGYRCRPCMVVKSKDYYTRHLAARREYARNLGLRHPKDRSKYRRLSSRELMEREPEKEAARRKLRNEVQKGRITKPSRCEDCQNPKEQRQLHGHHADYSKPLDVRWLCARCHGARHRLPLLPPHP